LLKQSRANLFRRLLAAMNAVSHSCAVVGVARQRQARQTPQKLFDSIHARQVAHLVLGHGPAAPPNRHQTRLTANAEQLTNIVKDRVFELGFGPFDGLRTRCAAQIGADQAPAFRSALVVFDAGERAGGHHPPLDQRRDKSEPIQRMADFLTAKCQIYNDAACIIDSRQLCGQSRRRIDQQARGNWGRRSDDDGIKEIALRSRGTPRIANRLLRRVRDFAQVKGDGMIVKKLTDDALSMLEVDPLGLDKMDTMLLLTVIDKFSGGPVGVETLAASIGEEKDTIEDVYEPFLIQAGFLQRTPRGRIATRLAYEHFGRKPGGPKDNQGTLF